jgi:D-serine dehydratase
MSHLKVTVFSVLRYSSRYDVAFEQGQRTQSSAENTFFIIYEYTAAV